MSVLEVSGLCGGYGKTPIIWDLSLEAKVGQIVTVVGPNGAGKSTFMKALFGLISVTSGSVRLDGSEVSGLQPHRLARAGIAYVPQVDNVFASMSIVENLEIGAFTRRGGTSERIQEILEIFPDLQKASRRKAGELSGGQRNMLGMARALMCDPKVILLDEPTAGLSPIYVDVVWEQVQRIAQLGTTVLVVEQNVDRALANSDWVYVMVAGRNRLDGPATEVAEMNLGEIFLGAVAAVRE
ncbi:MAG: ABC transporter ATP-binding protein [Acidimicrobiales bacterium]